MNHAFFNHYLREIQNCAFNETQQNVIEFIESQKKAYRNDPVIHAFLEAELAFYQHRYQESLKQYLKARHIPLFQFFCYRASAHLSLDSRLYDKAIKFTKRALQLKSNDYASLKLMSRLYAAKGRHEKARIVNNKIAYLKEKAMEPSKPANFQVSEQEFDEFNQIMAKGEDVTDRLFAQEFEELNCKFASNLSAYDDELVLRQIKAYGNRPPLKKDFALFFEELERSKNEQLCAAPSIQSPMKKERSGGYFVRWGGFGIAVNPGRHYLKNLQRHQLYIQDIDAVIITHGSPACTAECTAIWKLNLSMEKREQRERPVCYYVNSAVLESLQRIGPLANSVTGQRIVALERPVDGDEVSCIPLNDMIGLNYFFCASPAESFAKELPSSYSLGIVLELKGRHSVRIGYLSRLPWSPYLAGYLHDCQMLIAGVGKIEEKDIHDETYNQDSLGYGGVRKLVKEMSIDLILCSEYNLHHAGLLQMIVKNLRQEASPATTVLPVDMGLYIDLPSIRILSSDQKQMLKPPEVKMICLEETAASIKYCSIKNIL